MSFGAFIRIGIVWALACAALIGLVVAEGRARAAGTEVRFAMQAVDPRNLLSGHYVIVDLQRILPEGAACATGGAVGPTPNSFAWEETSGWLALRDDPGGAAVMAVTQDRASALAFSPLVARGAYLCRPATEGQSAIIDGETVDEPATDGWERVSLGISRFHINQTEALAIEERLREQQGDTPASVFALVSLGPDGRARLLGLEIEGERLMLSWN